MSSERTFQHVSLVLSPSQESPEVNRSGGTTKEERGVKERRSRVFRKSDLLPEVVALQVSVKKLS